MHLFNTVMKLYGQYLFVIFKERFLDVERVCRRVALIEGNGGSLLRYALSYLQVFKAKSH